jgi:hypothetical protein
VSSSSPSDLAQRLAYSSTESMIDTKFCRHFKERGYKINIRLNISEPLDLLLALESVEVLDWI